MNNNANKWISADNSDRNSRDRLIPKTKLYIIIKSDYDDDYYLSASFHKEIAVKELRRLKRLSQKRKYEKHLYYWIGEVEVIE